MKWLTLYRLGKKIVQIADAQGIRIKGVPVGELEQKIETVATTSKTLVDVFAKHS